MTNRFMISVAALALLAGTGFANAQGMSDKSDKGGSTGAQPMHQNAQQPGGAAERSGSTGREKGTVGQAGGQAGGQSSGSMKSGQSTEDRSSGAMNKNQAAEEKGEKAGPKGSRAEEHGQKSKSMSSESETKGGKEMKAEGREHNKNAEGREGRPGTNMKAEDREGRSGTNMKAEDREGRSGTNMNAEGRTGATSTQTTGQAGAGAKLSTEQRTRITSVIREQRVAPVNDVNFSIAIGSRVPRERVSLHPLPSEVVSIYPEWRGYEFILVRDQILVVDPRTLEIVAILEA